MRYLFHRMQLGARGGLGVLTYNLQISIIPAAQQMKHVSHAQFTFFYRLVERFPHRVINFLDYRL